jgi:mannose-1-phosphate guanylyltransferase
MVDHYYAVIMAGGSGTRLWPLSRQTRPKQMLSLFDERTLFQTAVERLDGVFSPDQIYVVTVEEQARGLREQAPEIPDKNFLLEPMPRGTASVVGLAATVLSLNDPEAVMAVLGSDHFIGNEPFFRDLLLAAYELAQEDCLVTLGIEPTYPATGFGYIQQGAHLGKYRGIEAYRVARFVEKPGLEQARQMLESKDFIWNSGMFVWKAARILAEFKKLMPVLAVSLKDIQEAWNTDDYRAILGEKWSRLRSVTIDYGIMEKADSVAVLSAAGLMWSDVGSWDSLFDVLESDHDGNIVMGGEHIGLDTHGSLVYVEKEHRLIVTIGVEDLVLVDTGDVLLVCRKDQAQHVRQIVMQLKEKGQIYL